MGTNRDVSGMPRHVVFVLNSDIKIQIPAGHSKAKHTFALVLSTYTLQMLGTNNRHWLGKLGR